MTPSPRIASFIQGFEQCRLESFLPTPNDVPTIGWGATGPDITLGMTWTQQQCDDRFTIDLARFGEGVSNLISLAATQDQYDAMVSLAYNIGLGAFGASTLLTLHNEGQYILAAEQFVRWNHQGGVVLDGLTRRREAEAAIYEGNG